MKFSEDLKRCRSDRPDEWTMDRFIKRAENIEQWLEWIAAHSILDAEIDYNDAPIINMPPNEGARHALNDDNIDYYIE